jgi:hypothetical protein
LIGKTTPSFEARGSGEGLIDQSMDREDTELDLADEDSSMHDMAFSRSGLDTTMEEVCFSRMWSRIFIRSVGVLYANEPPATMSRSRAKVMSKLAQKMFNDTSSDKGMPRLIAERRENLAHAAPRDSSDCSNKRMSLHGEGVRDKGENE